MRSITFCRDGAPLGRRCQVRHSAAAVRTEPPGDGPLSVKEVGSLLGQHKVPGASLAIIQNGEIIAAYGYGVAQPNRPVTPRTRFQAASISKTFARDCPQFEDTASTN